MSCYKVEKIHLTNFRNIDNSTIEFGSELNCIIGKNGNGKTNLIEAIYFLANKKSFRKNTAFPQILSIDSEKAEIYLSALMVDNKNVKFNYALKMNRESFYYFYNGKECKKKIKIDVVMINPFDSFSFFNTASFRRDWFNRHISMINSQYKSDLSNYNKALKFKNSLLLDKPNNYQKQLEVINLELAKYSVLLIEKRKKFLQEISDFYRTIFQSIFSEEHTISIKMQSKFYNYTECQISNFLLQEMEKEAKIGHAIHGIHKDDFLIELDGLNSVDYCSLGQQKVSYLGLLFAYIELFRYKFVSYPIVLIDDISGELDAIRWQRLVDYLRQNRFQVFFTTANEKFSDDLKKINGAKTIEVIAGRISC